MSKRAPNGSRAIVRQLKAEVALNGLDYAAKVYKVTPKYLTRVIHASDNGKLGNVWKSKKAVTVWTGRIAGEGKPASPRQPTTRKPAPVSRERKPREAPKPLDSLLNQRKVVNFTTDAGHTVTILPKWRKPNKSKQSHIIKSQKFRTPQEAARWLGEIGNLSVYAAVFFDGENWRVVVYPTEADVPKATVNAARDTGEFDENEY